MKQIIFVLTSFLFLLAASAQEGLYLRTQFWSGSNLEISWLFFTKDGVICTKAKPFSGKFFLAKRIVVRLQKAHFGTTL